MARKPHGQRRRTPVPSNPTVDHGRLDRVTLAGVAVLLVATLALVTVVRLRLADAPLERDEGEYAYAGQLILQGTPPYELAYNMKFPGTYYAYAAMMSVFGETPRGIRTGLLVVNVATVLLLFGVGRRVAGTFVGGIGACTFGLLALDRWSMGVFAHATHFVTLPVVAGLFVLWPARTDGRWWRLVVAGLYMGLAVVMKQQAFPFALLAIGLAAWSARSSTGHTGKQALRRASLVAAGIALTLAVLIAVLAVEGVLSRFWFWTIQYAAAYVSETPMAEALSTLGLAWGYITQSTGWIWYAGLAGIVLLFVTRWPNDVRVLLAGWIVAAALAIVPGFYFRPHYFIVAKPVIALLAAVAFATVDRGVARLAGAIRGRVTVLTLFAVVAALYVRYDTTYLFNMTTRDLMRALYRVNPFLEAPEIGRYLHAHTTETDRIAVFGSEPEIFFYAGRKSATGYIYTYPLMESQPYASRMQAEMRREIEAARPPYLVLVGVELSWMATPKSDRSILNWVNEYAAHCYERVGIADIPPAGDGTIVWDNAVRNYQSRSQWQVFTFHRTSAAGCASGAN